MGCDSIQFGAEVQTTLHSSRLRRPGSTSRYLTPKYSVGYKACIQAPIPIQSRAKTLVYTCCKTLVVVFEIEALHSVLLAQFTPTRLRAFKNLSLHIS